MEIINKSKPHCPFSDLNNGDVFMYEDTPYMRINKSNNNNNDIIAVNLQYGTVVFVGSALNSKWMTTGVKPVNASLMVTNKGE